MAQAASGFPLMSRGIPRSPEGEWCGHLPCVCESHQGCHKHNPMETIIYRNPVLPPKSQQTVEGMDLASRRSQPNTSRDEELPEYTENRPEPCSVFISQLPFDLQSVRTLAPIHPNLPYHLAFYHLHCIRRRLDPSVRQAFITELSCNGVFSHNTIEYTWLSEVYFNKGIFLQKQEVKYAMGPESLPQEIRLVSCPHHDLCIKEPVFKKVDGFTDVEIRLSGYQRQDESRQKVKNGAKWSASQGRYRGLDLCSICYADAEFTLEGVCDQLHVRFVCYRDLGSGDDRNSPKWLSLIAGVGYPNRAYNMNLVARVQGVAEAVARKRVTRAGGARNLSRRTSSSGWVTEEEYD